MSLKSLQGLKLVQQPSKYPIRVDPRSRLMASINAQLELLAKPDSEGRKVVE